MKRRSIVVSANTAWYLANFRAGLIRELAGLGYEVVAAANPDPDGERALAGLGCRFRPVEIDSKGVSPLRDLRTLAAYRRLLAEERPAAYLGSTIKPNVYGSLAAASLGIPAINTISGLGTAFIRRNWITALVERLYRVGLARSHRVFFQNADDRQLFLSRRLVRPDRTRLVPGSGIDLERFRPAAETRRPETSFLLIARLVRDKGVVEYAEAARRLRQQRGDLRFRLLGFLNVANRTAIDQATVDEWVSRGDIEYLGAADDVRPHIEAADCVVLPSYREGTSRVLLEAAAMARPIVATDVPGCREIVEDGINGYLCRPRDAESLADRLAAMADLSSAQRAEMGRAGRAKVAREYDERIVIDHYLAALAEVVP